MTRTFTQICLAAIIFIVSTSRPADAQVVFRDNAAQGGFNPFGPQQDPEKNQKKQFENQLKLRIDEIRRVCDLNEKEVQQLQTGAKGAVRDAMIEWKKQMKSFQKQIGGRIKIGGAGNAFNFGGIDDEDEDDSDDTTDDEDDKDDEDDMQNIRGVVNFIAPMMGGNSNPEDQRRWKNALKALSAEQREKLDAAEAERRKFRRATGVQNKVNQLDQQLRFTADQREKVMQVVDKVLGRSFENRAANQGMVITFGDQSQLRAKDMKDILSETQFSIFEESLRNNNPFQQAIRMNVNGNAVRVPGVGGNGAFFGASFDAGIAGNSKVKLQDIVPDGPADKAGFETGDVLTKIGKTKLDSSAAFVGQLATMKPGDEITIEFERDGEKKTAKVKLGKRDD